MKDSELIDALHAAESAADIWLDTLDWVECEDGIRRVSLSYDGICYAVEIAVRTAIEHVDEARGMS